uniref:ShKT domain-containing protein n=1 Tax=Setaria digitata TaxID=48799 RepID=A0A915PZ80_9BILA
MVRNIFWWYFASIVIISYQLAIVQAIACVTDQNCPSKGTAQEKSVCYRNVCYDSPGGCVLQLCPIGICVNSTSGEEVCVVKETAEITTTTTTTTTTAKPASECRDLVGPDGKSNCQQVAHLCNVGLYRELMKQQCRKTCGLCNSSMEANCTDKVGPDGKSNCAQNKFLCRNSLYRKIMKEQCPKTCGFCGAKKKRGKCADQVDPYGKSNCPTVWYLCDSPLYYQIMTAQCPSTCGRCLF